MVPTMMAKKGTQTAWNGNTYKHRSLDGYNGMARSRQTAHCGTNFISDVEDGSVNSIEEILRFIQ